MRTGCGRTFLARSVTTASRSSRPDGCRAQGRRVPVRLPVPAGLRRSSKLACPVGLTFPIGGTATRPRSAGGSTCPAGASCSTSSTTDSGWTKWGSHPASLEEAQRVASALVAAAPKLIPVYLHRMMQSEPHARATRCSPSPDGHHLLRVDLRDYLIHEFLAKEDVGPWPIPESVRRVPFWDIKQFLRVRWAGGVCVFDNSAGHLP